MFLRLLNLLDFFKSEGKKMHNSLFFLKLTYDRFKQPRLKACHVSHTSLTFMKNPIVRSKRSIMLLYLGSA